MLNISSLFLQKESEVVLLRNLDWWVPVSVKWPLWQGWPFSKQGTINSPHQYLRISSQQNMIWFLWMDVTQSWLTPPIDERTLLTWCGQRQWCFQTMIWHLIVWSLLQKNLSWAKTERGDQTAHRCTDNKIMTVMIFINTLRLRFLLVSFNRKRT